jgi:hypothetical protein
MSFRITHQWSDLAQTSNHGNVQRELSHHADGVISHERVPMKQCIARLHVGHEARDHQEVAQEVDLRRRRGENTA